MPATIRIATANDLKDFQPLFKEFQDHHFGHKPDIFINPKKIVLDRNGFVGLVSDPRRTLFLAFNGTTPVGMLLLSVLDLHPGELQHPRTMATVEMLHVRPKYRGHGIARQLLDAAYAWTREHGLKEIVLDVWSFSEEAVALFESEGFAVRTFRMIKELKD